MLLYSTSKRFCKNRSAWAKKLKNIAPNGWVYEQVCLAECFKLPTNLMANLLIYRVISSCGLFSRNLNTENEKNFY